jgi:ankyrin repeat protein
MDRQDSGGYTALHFAAQNFHVETVKALLKAGAAVDVPDNFGNSALGRATFNSRGRGDIIHLLLGSGADPNRPNKSGISPLKLAQTIGNYDVKQFFGN